MFAFGYCVIVLCFWCRNMLTVMCLCLCVFCACFVCCCVSVFHFVTTLMFCVLLCCRECYLFVCLYVFVVAGLIVRFFGNHFGVQRVNVLLFVCLCSCCCCCVCVVCLCVLLVRVLSLCFVCCNA